MENKNFECVKVVFSDYASEIGTLRREVWETVKGFDNNAFPDQAWLNLNLGQQQRMRPSTSSLLSAENRDSRASTASRAPTSNRCKRGHQPRNTPAALL